MGSRVHRSAPHHGPISATRPGPCGGAPGRRPSSSPDAEAGEANTSATRPCGPSGHRRTDRVTENRRSAEPTTAATGPCSEIIARRRSLRVETATRTRTAGSPTRASPYTAAAISPRLGFQRGRYAPARARQVLQEPPCVDRLPGSGVDGPAIHAPPLSPTKLPIWSMPVPHSQLLAADLPLIPPRLDPISRMAPCGFRGREPGAREESGLDDALRVAASSARPAPGRRIGSCRGPRDRGPWSGSRTQRQHQNSGPAPVSTPRQANVASRTGIRREPPPRGRCRFSPSTRLRAIVTTAPLTTPGGPSQFPHPGRRTGPIAGRRMSLIFGGDRDRMRLDLRGIGRNDPGAVRGDPRSVGVLRLARRGGREVPARSGREAVMGLCKAARWADGCWATPGGCSTGGTGAATGRWRGPACGRRWR